MGHWPHDAVVDRIVARCVRDGDCLVWQGSKGRGGYGYIRSRGKRVSVHRAVYQHRHGAIPDGLTIDHVKARGCRFTACCNIDHLEAVTSRENIMRGAGWAAVNARKTLCPNGHPLAGENLSPYWLRNGVRKCRICVVANGRARTRRWRRRMAVAS